MYCQHGWQWRMASIWLWAVVGFFNLYSSHVQALELLAHYNMEDTNLWSGANQELHDVGNHASGPFHGKAIGSPVPTSAYLEQARAVYPASTCSYAQHAGPALNGGAFLISGIPVDTSPTGTQSVSFWMYWDGTDSVSPLGWSDYKLVIKNSMLGFDANDGRIYGSNASALAKGWHHVAAIFANLDMTRNSLYVDGVQQSLTMIGTRVLNPIQKFDPDAVTTPQPPPGWFTDNPSGVVEVYPSSAYGLTSPTGRILEIENAVGDYNLYTLITPKKGEELTLSLDYAARPGFTSGTDSAIDVLLDGVFMTRLNTQVAQFQNFVIPLGYATGNTLRLEFRSVDRNSVGGLLTNIRALQNQAVPTASEFVIGGFGSKNTMRFSGRLDEVRLYKGTLTSSQIQADFNEVHACNRVSYLQIVHPGEGVACMPADIQINSCIGTDSNGGCIKASAGISGKVNASSQQGALISSQPFSIPQGTSNTRVALSVPVAQTVNLGVSDLNSTPDRTQAFECYNTQTQTKSCAYISHQAGFIFSAQANGKTVQIANQQAGVESPTYYLRAINTDSQSGACQAALQGKTTVKMGYQCLNPTTCAAGAGNLMRLTGTTPQWIAANAASAISLNTVDVPLLFDSEGNAPLTLNYFDVGHTSLWVEKKVNEAMLTGSSPFVTRPHHLGVAAVTTVAGMANPAAVNAAGPVFVKSGAPFLVKLGAYAQNDQATPNFGQEIVPENISVQATLAAPVGGSVGLLSNTQTMAGSFKQGLATLDNVRWSEVGIITLLPVLSDADYLGAGNVSGETSGTIGRFYPDHFNVSLLISQVACGSFNYFGQDGWQTRFQLSARSQSDSVTENYQGAYGSSFAKFNLTHYADYHFSLSPASYQLGVSAQGPTGSWVHGQASVVATHLVNRPLNPAPEDQLTLLTRPVDDDGVSSLTAMPVSMADTFRFGRLFMLPAHGSELLALPIQVEAQYWKNQAYVRNSADSCTLIPLASIVMKNYHGNLNACETHLSGNAKVSQGVSRFKLTAPGVGTDGRPNSGSVDLKVNIGPAQVGDRTCLGLSETSAMGGSLPWFGTDPASRATFGIYKSPIIYLREVF